MKKRKAVTLLRSQIGKIHDNSINRETWLLSTSSLLLQIFPVSGKYKTEQLEKIQNNPDYFESLSALKKIEARKAKAENYLNNYLEEIEVLGLENPGNKLALFFGSFRFWTILFSACILSFLAGTSFASTGLEYIKRSGVQELHALETEINLQKKEIDSLKSEILELHTIFDLPLKG